MTYNVLKGSPVDDIAADVRRHAPDVALLQEVDRGTARARGEDQPLLLAEALGMNVFYAPSYAVDGGTTGEAILSRLHLTDGEVVRVEQGRSIGAMARLKWHGRSITVISAHLSATFKPDLDHIRKSGAARVREAKRLAEIVTAPTGDVILGADLNATPGTDPYETIAAALPASGISGATYPAAGPLIQIDHIFVSEGLAPTEGRLGPKGVSDHLPVIVDLVPAPAPPLPPGTRP
jgi:endonuclease/exonuclease/phosphatase family metal-dependent hydrolase